MKIRRARENEAARLSALARASKAQWGYPAEVLEGWRAQLTVRGADIRDRPTFVIEEADEIVGFYALAGAGRTWALEHFWVAPKYTRQGIGRRMLAHALELAASNGAAEVSVDADPNAEAFYLDCGAERRGAVPAAIAGQPDRVRPQLRFRLRPSSA